MRTLEKTLRYPVRSLRLHYSWIVVGVTFLTLLATAGIRSAPGVLMLHLEHEFGWSRETVAAAISLNLLLYGLVGPFSAALLDYLGVRATMATALALTSLGMGLTPLVTAPWQLILLWGVLVGGGTGMTALALGATVVNRWFAERRGVVMGGLSASSATGQLVFLPILASLVAGHNWRWAALLVAGGSLLVLPVVLLLMRDRPEDVGMTPYGTPDGPRPQLAPAASANPFGLAIDGFRRGVRERGFWVLAGSFLICGASTSGLVGTHLIAACADHGIPEVRAAGLLALMGLFDLAGTIASGWLADRLDNRKLLCVYYALRGLSLLVLPQTLAGSEVSRTVFAIFYGLDWIATVPPTVRLTGDLFGRERAGVVFGWMVAAHQIGASLASLGAGALRSLSGDYGGAFLAAGLLCQLAAVAVLRVRR
jgi:sugar phosphate permease